MVVDESHVSLPQIGGMFNGDRARKLTLVEYGFRLPSALDNRPLQFDEFMALVPQMIAVSATPGEYELRLSEGAVVEQIIRPTGLVDPEVDVRPVQGQVDDLLHEIRLREARSERVLVTTLTKRMSEDLTDYLQQAGVRVRYLHSDIDAIERMEILRGLRLGEFDVLVGINLLREGLDLPEVSLVAILDADQEGFLRSDRSLVQTVGRAARNLNGRAILYADRMTGSMQRALDEMDRRRELQQRLQRGARHHAALDREVDGGGAALDPRGRRPHRAPRAQGGGAGAGAISAIRRSAGRDDPGAGAADARGGGQPRVRAGGDAARPAQRAPGAGRAGRPAPRLRAPRSGGGHDPLADAGRAGGRGRAAGAEPRAPGAWSTFEGELGAGKTTLIQAIARGLGVTGPATSPTYALVHRYQGRRGPVFHLDCYRLRTPDEAADLDWEGLLAEGDAILIEWPERAGAWLPAPTRALPPAPPGGAGAPRLWSRSDDRWRWRPPPTGRRSRWAPRPSDAVEESLVGARRHAARCCRWSQRAARLGGASALDEVEAWSLSDGPGSFTGLRVGAAVAKALVQARGTSALGRAVAHGPGRGRGRRRGALVLAVADALRGEVYAAAFRFEPGRVAVELAPAVRRPEDLAGLLPAPALLVGDLPDPAGDRDRGVGRARRLVRSPDGAARARSLLDLVGRTGGARRLTEVTCGSPTTAGRRRPRHDGRRRMDAPYRIRPAVLADAPALVAIERRASAIRGARPASARRSARPGPSGWWRRHRGG